MDGVIAHAPPSPPETPHSLESSWMEPPLKQHPFNSSQTVRDPCGVSTSYLIVLPFPFVGYFRPSSTQTTATGESHFYLHLERATNMMDQDMTQARIIPRQRFHTHPFSVACATTLLNLRTRGGTSDAPGVSREPFCHKLTPAPLCCRASLQPRSHDCVWICV